MHRRTKSLSGALLLIITIAIGCNDNRDGQRISLKTLPPVVMMKNGAEIFQYWEFKNDPSLWDTSFAQPPSLLLYKDSLITLLGKDTFNLTVQKLAFQSVSFKTSNTDNGDAINAELIHAKTIGKIRPINYLEAQLVDYQISRYPLLSHPTEFHGLILLHDSLNLVRVYFAASDQPWPPKPAVILEAVKNDLKQGWTFKYHLHNHYEPKSNHYVGILAPSMTDAQFHMFLAEDYNLEKSLVTNGLHTVEIDRSDFQKLKLPL